MRSQEQHRQEIGQSASKSTGKRNSLFIAITLCLLLVGAIIMTIINPFVMERYSYELSSWLLGFVTKIGLALVLIQVAFLLYILSRFMRYKAVESVRNEQLPSATVIVPAYNEGELVYHTLKSLVNSDYPEQKLEILAIDDGSKDDTWQWMLKAESEFGARIRIMQQPLNKGKRHALYRGFKMGKSEVFVTVDSDSIVNKDTLRNLLSPFVLNPKCGAVAGNVAVLNKKEGIIPRMLNVSFVFSFEFIRSAQSTLGSVLCTPGALAAYRKTAVDNCVEQWITQTFRGKASDIGEDRAMTNMILKQGYHVVFQKNAYVYTNTPLDYQTLSKMFIRWERSNVRENIMMSKFAFTKFRTGSTLGPRILLLNQWLKVILAIPLTLLMFYFVLLHPLAFIASTLIGLFVFSSIQVFFFSQRYNLKDSLYAYPYSLFYTLTLFWITPYAILTASRKGWLTRELVVKAQVVN